MDVTRVVWKPSYRIISDRTRALATLAASDEERRAAGEVLALVDPATRQYVERIPDLRAMIGRPGWQILVQPFVIQERHASRFSDGSYGVYYAAAEVETAMAEVKYHRTRLLRSSRTQHARVTLACYGADMNGTLHDIRGQSGVMPEVYSAADPPEGYRASQELGLGLFHQGSNGIAYDSVRRALGQCVGVFRPVVFEACRQHGRLVLEWDGRDFVDEWLDLSRPN